MDNRQLRRSLVTGALLGVLCIIGAGLRLGYAGHGLYLAALWYNRLIMGFLIGLTTMKPGLTGLIKGALLGTMVSLAFYLSTGMTDHASFLAGTVYGVIIVAVARP